MPRSSGDADPDPTAELIAFITAQPGLARRLLAEHIDDGSGHCRVCTDGAQTGRWCWPCRIHDCARCAEDMSRRS